MATSPNPGGQRRGQRGDAVGSLARKSPGKQAEAENGKLRSVKEEEKVEKDHLRQARVCNHVKRDIVLAQEEKVKEDAKTGLVKDLKTAGHILNHLDIL